MERMYESCVALAPWIKGIHKTRPRWLGIGGFCDLTCAYPSDGMKYVTGDKKLLCGFSQNSNIKHNAQHVAVNSISTFQLQILKIHVFDR